MIPAHQHLATGPLLAVAMDHRLEVGNELRGFHRALHFMAGGHGAFLQNMPDRAGYHAEKYQQAEQWRIFAFHIAPGFALGETGCHGKSVSRGGQFVLRYRKERQGSIVELTVGGQPMWADLQRQ
ncbi:hypothetical protein D3C85_1092990 [compost metagenome]